MARMIALVCVAAVGTAALAAEDPSVQPREWWINLQAPTQTAVYGTFAGVQGGFVLIRLPDGEVRKIIAGNLGWKDLAYVQRLQTRIPAHLRRPAVPEGLRPLIDLSVERLPLGPVLRWPNAGTLGGKFHAANEALPIEVVAGRKAVRFYYGPWNLPLEFPSMVADFYAPARLAANGPFTAAAWLYNPSALGVDMSRETVLSWHGIGGDDGTDVGYGAEGRYSFERSQVGGAYCGAYGGFGFPDAVWPALNAWHHIVYVFDGKRDGTLKLFVDGRPATVRSFKRSILVSPASEIGETGATINSDLYVRDGKPVTVTLYLGEEDSHYLRGTADWKIIKNLGQTGPGLVKVTVAGLKPGTRYYYRMCVTADDETRWSDGSRSFVTAGRGKPGRNDPKDADKLMFLGSSWGSQWDWATRPRWTFTGAIASLKLFGRALSDTEVVALCRADGMPPKPGFGARPQAAAQTQSAYFTPEFDGPVSEPMPKEIRQSGAYGKLMEAVGQSVISGPKCPDDAMRLCSYTLSKMLEKRPDIVEAMEALNCGASLGYDGMGDAWSEMITQAYGDVKTFQLDPLFYWGPNIMYHEMGHQFHMWGAEQIEADFRQRLYRIFWENKKRGLWIGDYGGFNLWEYIAVNASQFGSDGDPEDLIIRRETLRRTDPRMFYFLEDYWPGDKLIELLAGSGMHAGRNGVLTAWDNQGGLEYWGKLGLAKHPRSVGAFRSFGSPRAATVGGAACVALGVHDGLRWTCRTRECLIRNHAWSVEGWVRKERYVTADEALVSWGGVQVLWGRGPAACDFGRCGRSVWRRKPTLGAWHHLVVTFKGGGLANGAGRLAVFVDGRLDHEDSVKLDISSGQRVTVGGFKGAIAQLRVYDYQLGDLQVAKYYDEQRSYFTRKSTRVAGELLVDLDAQSLAPCPRYQTRPLYPLATRKGRLRSWANLGTLGGKLQNDVLGTPSSPKTVDIDGVDAIAFSGTDRMVSSFLPEARMNRPATVELWLRRSPEDPGGTVFEWGGLRVDSAKLAAGRWIHVCAAGRIPTGTRMHLGARFAGGRWEGFFRGAVAQVRVHSDLLPENGKSINEAASDLRLASHPEPADGASAVAERKPKLSWQLAAGKPGLFNVYLGATEKEVAKAGRKSACYMGAYGPGEFAPNLRPGRTYCWRVDGENGRLGNVWRFKTAKGAVLDLSAGSLKAGPVAEWKSTGASGGSFKPADWGAVATPSVSIRDGRKAVDFSNGKCLVSSFQMPVGTKSFAVAVWAYSVSVPEAATMAAWGGASFNNARSPRFGAFAFHDSGSPYEGYFKKLDEQHTNAPLVNYWNHIAYTYSGGVLRVYVNGRLNLEKATALPLRAGRLSLGALLNADGRWMDSYPGMLANVQIYSYGLSTAEVGCLSGLAGRRPDASRRLVYLTAEGLREGPLSLWPNRGVSGGAFVVPFAKGQAPVAGIVGGRPAVTFDGVRAFLRSNVTTPAGVTRRRPVTIEAWVFNPSIEDAETIFSLAPRKSLAPCYDEDICRRALEIRYGKGAEFEPGAVFTGADARSLGWMNGKPPESGAWHHLAFVYDGQLHGRARLYVDGDLQVEKGWYTLSTMPGLQMYLGTAWNTDRGPQDMFSGSIASLRVFDYAKSPEEVLASARAGAVATKAGQ